MTVMGGVAQKSVLIKVFSGFFKKVGLLKPEIYVFFSTQVFYFLLWFVNPNNKLIAASFVVLIFVYYYRLKNARLSLLLAYIASLVVFTGKRYSFELVPPGFFPIEVFPLGYVVHFVISPSHVLAFLMTVVLISDLVRSNFKLVKIKLVDVLITAHYVWVIVSDLLVSKKPEMSLLFSVSSLHLLVFYFFIRAYYHRFKKFSLLLVWLLAAIVMVESAISARQLLAGAPIFRNIEAQVDIEFFGKAVDELEFRFRPAGTFQHANSMGAWLSFVLVAVFAAMYKLKNQMLFGVFLVGVTTLSVTLSRSAWLGFLIAFLAIFYVFEKVKKFELPQVVSRNASTLIAIGLILFVIFVLPRAEKTLYSFGEGGGGGYLRSLQIQDTLSLIMQRPVFGVGTSMSVLEGLAFNPSGIFSRVALEVHNWYLLVAVEHGVPAFLFFVWFVLLSIRSVVVGDTKSKMRNLNHFIQLGFVFGMIAIGVVGVLQPFIDRSLVMLAVGIIQSDSKT